MSITRCLALLLLLPACLHAAPAAEQWFTVLLDGRKTGSLELRREARDGAVVTTQKLDLELDRDGSRVAVQSVDTATEKDDGTPLAFSSRSRFSGADVVVKGTVRDGRIEAVIHSGGEAHQRQLDWPTDALLAEGMRLAARRAGLMPGTRHSMLAFQPAALEAMRLDAVVGDAEPVELPGGTLRLHPVRQAMRMGGATLDIQTWVDAEHDVHKMVMPMLGVELTLLACDRACALAANQPGDIFARSLLRSPRPLSRGELAGALRYTLEIRGDGDSAGFPDTHHQAARRGDGHWRVTVDAAGAAGHSNAPPRAADSAPSEWLQSSAPDIIALARRAVGDAEAPAARMQRIEAFVRGYIQDKTLGVGYASALEVARNPQGDCTEHALLLAALGRAAGVPTRVVFGLAYTPSFAGQEQVFVPHAWTEAYVDGNWQGFDAALAGFDAGHLALSIGDGDPWRFYAGLDLIGRLAIRGIEPAGRD
ncbi:MAG: transglutaminase domain-containing protein [Xanthomonadales bacterium]|nr:transglutaminase domain-containing protein [Xanthomonadales bacterium]